jgi:thiamine biosynthesis lipoprotein
LPKAAQRTTAWEFEATGTRWRLHHSGALDQAGAVALAAAVAQDEARWSRFAPDSEITALNRRAGEWLEVSAPTLALLNACARWMDCSGGVFTPLVGQALVAWGYVASLSAHAPYAERSPVAEPLLGALRVDRAGGRVWFAPGTALDLGGIGKGWMLGRAGAVLSAGCSDPELLIDAGGDLLAVRGEHTVAVESVSAAATGVAGWVTLGAGQAIATSGCGRRRWVNGDGRSAHHLLDPHTGAPGPWVHATVVADDPAAADVMAKVLALRPERAANWPHPALVQRGGGYEPNAAWRRVARRSG